VLAEHAKVPLFEEFNETTKDYERQMEFKEFLDK
jgi:hypothetical protein